MNNELKEISSSNFRTDFGFREVYQSLPSPLKYSIFFALFLIFGFFSLYAYWFYYHLSLNLSTSPTDWGAFGDFIGGILNPLLTFISFIALLSTIVLQMKELQETKRELKINQKIFEAQSQSAKEQSHNIFLQRIDGSFFNHTNILFTIMQTYHQGNVDGNEKMRVDFGEYQRLVDEDSPNINNIDNLMNSKKHYDIYRNFTEHIISIINFLRVNLEQYPQEFNKYIFTLKGMLSSHHIDFLKACSICTYEFSDKFLLEYLIKQNISEAK